LIVPSTYGVLELNVAHSVETFENDCIEVHYDHSP
jgi:hypothetical protein